MLQTATRAGGTGQVNSTNTSFSEVACWHDALHPSAILQAQQVAQDLDSTNLHSNNSNAEPTVRKRYAQHPSHRLLTFTG